MIRLRNKPSVIPGILLSTLLIAAQSIALAHAFEHDNSALQSQTCTTCVAASQLASACVDTSAIALVSSPPPTIQSESITESDSIRLLVVRQRGPPTQI